MEELKQARRRAVGAKETLKHLTIGDALRVYIARDADEHVRGPVIQRARDVGVEVVEVESMQLLGRACGIDVGAAAAALIGGGEQSADH
ncbi:MAG: ribosomal L7Ae/L30e/S12e/Gadd45 family protein [Thermaerobacter sp.]|nr:ribosomal L7Ae/L30e/S12e/Gadd45 family protein [Thermaerobacter sp.]